MVGGAWGGRSPPAAEHEEEKEDAADAQGCQRLQQRSRKDDANDDGLEQHSDDHLHGQQGSSSPAGLRSRVAIPCRGSAAVGGNAKRST